MLRASRLTTSLALAAVFTTLAAMRDTQAAGESISVWMTTADGSRLLAQQPSVAFGPDTGMNATTIDVSEATTYQTMDGFGSSLTDSSAWPLWNRLSASQRDTLLHQLFDPTTGNSLSILRQPMGASDFALSTYNYDNTCCDVNDFSIGYELADIVPLLKQIRAINPSLLVMGVPWRPTAWMKTSSNDTLAQSFQLLPQP